MVESAPRMTDVSFVVAVPGRGRRSTRSSSARGA
ncbi:hypothetical protein Ae406Ps2_4351c [Pseudonocardia sp. Ae406_Ps2]|nr:hypothetical protein Ae331Ps2_1608 [Pseudonocardia sp. Ae331_Ps2]OLM04351.1 hypothetical protein Ae406Ps2_4351c [Pseudonocardia sp. Ae406_Ps2]